MLLHTLMFIVTILLSHVLAYSVPSSAALSTRTEDEKLTARFAELDLAERQSALNTKARRWCIKDLGVGGACTSVAGSAGEVARSIAGMIRHISDAGNCVPRTDSGGGLNWNIYYAARTCEDEISDKTTEAIRIFFNDYLRDSGFKICGAHCIGLANTVFVTIAPASQSLTTLYCGPQTSFSECG